MKQLLSILTAILVCLSSPVMAYEKRAAGPYYIPANTKKLAVSKTYTFDTQPTEQAFLIVEKRGAKNAKITLNGQVLVNTRTKFIDNKIKLPVSLLSTNNLESIAYGKVYTSVIVSIIKELVPVEQVSISCLVVDKERSLFVPATVEAHLISDGTKLYDTSDNVTGAFFSDLPVNECFLLSTVTDDGRKGSAIVFTDPKCPVASSVIYLQARGERTISGWTAPKTLVHLRFTNYYITVLSDENGAYSFTEVPIAGAEREGLSLSAQTPGGVAVSTIYREIPIPAQDMEENIPDPVEPCPINKEWFNGDFSYGLFGWEYTEHAALGYTLFYWGDTDLYSEPATKELNSRAKPEPEDPESIYTAVLEGVEGNHTRISKAYMVPPNATKLVGYVRWISEEWHSYINYHFPLSTFSVKIVAADGEHVLAGGNVKTTPMDRWEYHVSGITPPIPIEFDLTDYRGQTINFILENSSANRLMLILLGKDFEIETEEGMFFHSEGIWNMPTGESFQAGQKIEFQLESVSPYPTQVNILDHETGDYQSAVINPTGTASSIISFDNWGKEPMNWRFSIDSGENLNNVVHWEAWSTWVPGMEPNE